MDLIINANARMHLRDPQLAARMRSAMAGHGGVHVTHSVEELAAVCQALRERKPELVMLSGGDGSLMSGTSALARSYEDEPLPAIAPVPGGTAGTIARNWGIHGDPLQCLKRLLAGPRRHTVSPSLAVSVERGGAGTEPDGYVGFILGSGLVAQFFKLYYDRGAPGYSGAARLVTKIFAGSFVGSALADQVLQPLPFELHVNGERMPPPAWSLVCASVVRNLGLHMLLNHRAGEDPQRPHLVATPLPPGKLGPRAPLVLAGRPLGGEGNVDRLVEEFSICFDSSGPFVLDGELMHARRIHVKAGPMLRIARC